MGTVWRARDRRTGRYLAAKLLRPEYVQDDPSVVSRFFQEKLILVKLSHPNIVQLHDLVVEGFDLAIIMDLVDGGSLGDYRRSKTTLPPSQAAGLATAILDALALAHAQSVLHRDVKPDNVLLAKTEALGPGDVRLGDFSIARLVDDVTAHRTTAIGTPSYMPPELLASGDYTDKSDVYSCGILLYELLAGRTPFDGPGVANTVSQRHLLSSPPVLPLDPALWNLLAQMLAKQPADRLSAAETAAALRSLPESALAGPALPAQPIPEQWLLTAAATGPAPLLGGRPTAADESRTARPATSQEAANITSQSIDSQATGGQAAEPTASWPAADHDATRLRLPRQSPTPAADPDQGDTLGPLGALEPAGSPALVSAPPASPLVAHDGLTRLLPEPAQPPSPPPAGQAAVLAAADRPAGLFGARRWQLIGGSLVLIAAAILVLCLTGVFSEPPAPPPAVCRAESAHLRGDLLPSGLQLDLDAACDTETQQTRLSVTAAAPRSTGLAGDILLAVPPFEGETCPELTPPDGLAIKPLTASADGVQAACAYKLSGLQLAAAASLSFDIAVGGAPPQERDYAAWLGQVQAASAETARQITGAAFPLQRVQALTVEAASVKLGQGGTNVPYQVKVSWNSQTSPPLDNTLFQSDTLPTMATETLKALTGGAGFAGVTVTACSAAQAGVNGVSVLADQPTDSCALTIQVGELQAKGSFAIWLN
jgi:serine/threonine-protein kinase